ncbi:hypothetical protein, unlikely [Trypanosoma brucei brucei TREU927]|uniref:Uncharacterized protein n=1 Tax=Trypanosoma brucei brucei (strain 927/4 GUTat10.1) TaxID=185431 RepID=Q4GZ33_TRYB2|nr:hypothetical protein, unlikely [Trypanosoma brucei brucei TREU927]CAJ16229.1 hypothetical protein, unlikely [Trypanosoma brucei brucei TREU927]
MLIGFERKNYRHRRERERERVRMSLTLFSFTVAQFCCFFLYSLTNFPSFFLFPCSHVFRFVLFFFTSFVACVLFFFRHLQVLYFLLSLLPFARSHMSAAKIPSPLLHSGLTFSCHPFHCLFDVPPPPTCYRSAFHLFIYYKNI